MWKRAAKRVKEWRRAHDDMSQEAFAQLAGISIGTLQGFESGARGTRELNVAKIAAVRLTREALLNDDAPTEEPNPLLTNLRTEDLVIANQFHHAAAEVKYATKHFLSPAVSDEVRERLALILRLLLQLDDDRAFEAVTHMLAVFDPATPPSPQVLSPDHTHARPAKTTKT